MAERVWPVLLRSRYGDMLLVADVANVAALDGPVQLQCETIDAIVALLDSTWRDSVGIERVIDRLVGWPTDWVQVLGEGSESVHDAIDAASVRLGRQACIGDGSPMTAWHDDIRSFQDMAEYVVTGGHGGCDAKVVVAVGAADRVEALIAALSDLI